MIILVAAAIGWIARELSARPVRAGAAGIYPREVLDRRLACGKIKTEQYGELGQTPRGAA